MKTVSKKFGIEQTKLRTLGIRWDVKATANGVTKDLTPYICNDSLSRIEWRIENDLAGFTSPDWQCMLWYDEDLWDWLNENDNILVVAKCGFFFEKLDRFFGYVDKDYLKKHSLGKIELRVYSFIEYLKSIKTEDVFGGVASPPYNIPLKDAVETIFDYLELTSQTIKVLPFDTYPNAEEHVLSFLSASPADYGNREMICRITDKKFYYLCSTYLYLITFNDDYTDFTIETLEHIEQPFDIQKWGDDKFAIITGTGRYYSFKSGGSWVPRSDMLAGSIIFYDGSGNYLSTQSLSSFTNGSYTYIPMAYGIQKYDRKGRYVIYFHGTATSTPNKVDRCAVRVYDSDTHAVIYTLYLDSYYKHPQNRSATGYYTGRDYFFMLLCLNSDFNGNVSAFRLTPVKDQWEYFIQETSYTAAQLEGRMDCIGHYTCFTGQTSAYDNKNNVWEANFWTYADSEEDFLGRAVRHTPTLITDPYQVLTYYNKSNNHLEIKALDIDDVMTATNVTTPFATGQYPITGFTYWWTYKNKPGVIGMIVSNNVLSIGVIANRIYPYVKRPPLSENENLAETIKNLAIAGCCIFNFPDNDTGIFISRMYWDEDNVHPIKPSLFYKTWSVKYEAPRRIVVTSGNMSVEVGDEVKSLSIDCDYIPDHDQDIGRAYGQIYHDFLIAYPFIIGIDTDFLIQFEPFDLVRPYDRTGSEQYQGRLMKTVQEGPRIEFEIRGAEL